MVIEKAKWLSDELTHFHAVSVVYQEIWRRCTDAQTYVLTDVRTHEIYLHSIGLCIEVASRIADP